MRKTALRKRAPHHQYSIRSEKMGVDEPARDEHEAVDDATVYAEEYPGDRFTVYLGSQPQVTIWYDGKSFHHETHNHYASVIKTARRVIATLNRRRAQTKVPWEDLSDENNWDIDINLKQLPWEWEKPWYRFEVGTVMRANFFGHDVTIRFDGVLDVECDKNNVAGTGDIKAVDFRTTLPEGALIDPIERFSEKELLSDLWWELVWFSDHNNLQQELFNDLC